jgi:hypothetical protein
VLGLELSYFDIKWLKGNFTNPACSTFKSGRTVVALQSTSLFDSFPGLFYTFEVGSDSAISQWRAMQR